jgi:hypothetical protein
MKVLNAQSLGLTIDAITQAHFFGREIPHAERARAAKWITGRQGMPGAYRVSFFAPTELDFAEGFHAFTGEHITSRAATSHIIGEESCRALAMLGVNTLDVRGALDRANTALEEWVDCAENGGPGAGTFCCGKCSVALWRNLLTHGPGTAGRRLAAGMKALKAGRDGGGKWKRFPFHYTLLALGEIDSPLALAEIRYAAPVIERALKLPARGEYGARRHAVMERALARI